MFYTYVLYSKKFDRIYVGQTNNLKTRLEKHNTGLIFSTKPYEPWEMIYHEEFDTRAESMKREKELKSHKGRDYIRNKLVRVRHLPD
jgi:putative endonuclease